LQPTLALLLLAARNASAAGLVPCHTAVDTQRHTRIDANALHHAIHQLGMAKDPLQHRAVVTKIAHSISSSP
jgi:hypothetical protein